MPEDCSSYLTSPIDSQSSSQAWLSDGPFEPTMGWQCESVESSDWTPSDMRYDNPPGSDYNVSSNDGPGLEPLETLGASLVLSPKGEDAAHDGGAVKGESLPLEHQDINPGGHANNSLPSAMDTITEPSSSSGGAKNRGHSYRHIEADKTFGTSGSPQPDLRKSHRAIGVKQCKREGLHCTHHAEFCQGSILLQVTLSSLPLRHIGPAVDHWRPRS